ncbi:MAG: phospho-sugar mutase [Acidimicrobiales bacterium]
MVADWCDQDPDPATRAEVDALIAAGDVDGLTDRFSTRLAFGTAGLRGELGAGPNRMNRLVVRQAAAGLVSHLGSGPRVVIGHDARHGSADFAADSAAVVAAAGGTALCLPALLPTPLVPFAVRRLGADAGVMVTASHNPPRDNGYKVYLDDGAQLVPPIDEAIAGHIAAAAIEPVTLAPDDDEGIVAVGSEIVDAYLDVVADCRLVADSVGLPVVYTAMHGVGRDLILAAFDRVGFPAPSCVPEQCDPDPDFPTVAFPNPEEPGALDLAMAHADATGLDLIVASDPDADRLGVAVRSSDGWRALTGNEIGVLLADHILRHTSGPDRLVVTTIVSSQLLGTMARSAGVHYAETLTGFKWIMRPALDDPTRRLVFAYEEALGYAVSDEVRDKDGVTAAVMFVELAGLLAAEGRTVLDRLDDLAVEHGLHATDTWAIRVDGPGSTERLADMMRRVRTDPPTTLGSAPVIRVHDYLDAGDLAPTDAVLLQTDDGIRVVVRPSGTEPKAKVYLERVAPVTGTVGEARDEAARRLARVRDDLAVHLGLDTAV